MYNALCLFSLRTFMTQPIKFFTKRPTQIETVPPGLTVDDVMIYLKTTETCQLNCQHCFTNGINGRKIYFDPERTVDWLHRFSKEACTEHTRGSIAFHGGEPFLAPIEDIRYVWSNAKDLLPNVWWSSTTNLAYNLTDDIRSFMKEAFVSGVATSWDKDIRFANEKQEALWRKNVQTLQDDGHSITLMVSLSKSVLDMCPEEFLKWVIDLGVPYLHLERITNNGNAMLNSHIMPTNQELDDWFVRLWDASVKIGAHKYFDNLFFNSILSSFVTSTHSGCRCRSCEKKVFTVNADGTIGGCANSAVTNTYGHISDSINTLLTSPGRVENIVCESARNPACYTCEVFDVCNGDCHQLAWDGDICASPKTLMTRFKTERNMALYKEVLSNFKGTE